MPFNITDDKGNNVIDANLDKVVYQDAVVEEVTSQAIDVPYINQR